MVDFSTQEKRKWLIRFVNANKQNSPLTAELQGEAMEIEKDI